MFGDDDQRTKVLAAKDPKDCQRLGRQAKNNTGIDWSEHEKDVMTKVCLAKYRGNRMARNALLRTGNCALGEASRSSKWGIGMYANNPDAHDQGRWADNLLGTVLVSVRNTIRKDIVRPNPTAIASIIQTIRHQGTPS
jgi:hypothetical protein